MHIFSLNLCKHTYVLYRVCVIGKNTNSNARKSNNSHMRVHPRNIDFIMLQQDCLVYDLDILIFLYYYYHYYLNYSYIMIVTLT